MKQTNAQPRMAADGNPQQPLAGDRPKIGLLAGGGRYPFVVAEALARQGIDTYCLGVKGHADPKLAEVCTDFEWVGLLKLGHGSRYLRRNGVGQVTMAGKIYKHVLFQPWAWLAHMPDWRTMRAMYRHFVVGRQDGRDDSWMLGLVAEVLDNNLAIVPATDFAPELLVKSGQLTRRAPSAAEHQDIEFGWKLAKEMGRLDVGQSVAVKRLAPVAVEAMEGTDQCIQRAGTLCGGGFTVVKVAKPHQDMRFDVPTIGTDTLRSMVKAGSRCLAIEADRTILIDQDAVVDYANEHNLAIVALEHGVPAPAEQPVTACNRPLVKP